MSPISATRVMAVSRPTPGRTMSAWTLGSGLASAPISWSSLPIGVARASSNPQQSSMIAPGIGGSSRSASHARPGPVHRLDRSGIPRSASTACTRFLQAVDERTRLARWRSRARRSRTSGGAIQVSGSRSARSSCASVRASTFPSPASGQEPYCNKASAARVLAWIRCEDDGRGARPAGLTLGIHWPCCLESDLSAVRGGPPRHHGSHEVT
jgi:hypothetical protein